MKPLKDSGLISKTGGVKNLCEVCILGKQCQQPYISKPTLYSKPLKLWKKKASMGTST